VADRLFEAGQLLLFPLQRLAHLQRPGDLPARPLVDRVLEDAVAGGAEARPEGVAAVAADGTARFPFRLQRLRFLGRRDRIGRDGEGLGGDAELLLAAEVVGLVAVAFGEARTAALEERLRRGAEPRPELVFEIAAADRADFFPGRLESLHRLG